MNIGFIIGETEQHEMELSFDQITGDLCMLMDGTQVLHEMPRLANDPVQHYELYVGDGEKHRLALQLTYGGEPDEPSPHAVPRLSLVVTAVAPQDVVPEGLGLNGTDSLLAASTAARVQNL